MAQENGSYSRSSSSSSAVVRETVLNLSVWNRHSVAEGWFSGAQPEDLCGCTALLSPCSRAQPLCLGLVGAAREEGLLPN